MLTLIFNQILAHIISLFSCHHLVSLSSNVLTGSASVGTSSPFAYPLSYLPFIVVRSLCPCHLFSLFIL